MREYKAMLALTTRDDLCGGRRVARLLFGKVATYGNVDRHRFGRWQKTASCRALLF